jgi:hypothetical protein
MRLSMSSAKHLVYINVDINIQEKIIEEFFQQARIGTYVFTMLQSIRKPSVVPHARVIDIRGTQSWVTKAPTYTHKEV